MEGLIDAFAADLLDELDRAPRTIQQYRARLRAFERWFSRPIELITEDDVKVFRRDARNLLASATIRSRIVTYRRFRYWAAEAKIIPLGDVPLLRAPKEVSRPTRPVPVERVRAMLDSCETSLEFRSVYGGYYAGLRNFESAQLGEDTWQDGWLGVLGKGRKWREVPVHPALEQVRDEVLEHEHPHRESVRKAGVRVARRVGFHVGTHQFRATFATQLYDEAVDDRSVKALLGHSGGSTDRYVDVSRRRKQAAMGKLHYRDPEQLTLSMPGPDSVAAQMRLF